MPDLERMKGGAEMKTVLELLKEACATGTLVAEAMTQEYMQEWAQRPTDLEEQEYRAARRAIFGRIGKWATLTAKGITLDDGVKAAVGEREPEQLLCTCLWFLAGMPAEEAMAVYQAAQRGGKVKGCQWASEPDSMTCKVAQALEAYRARRTTTNRDAFLRKYAQVKPQPAQPATPPAPAGDGGGPNGEEAPAGGRPTLFKSRRDGGKTGTENG